MPAWERLQLRLPIPRASQADRNRKQGGRSFYFFDFDDNVMHLPTSIFLFDAHGRERALSTQAFAQVAHAVGKDGEWRAFRVDPDDLRGSFRRFRDHGGCATLAEPFCEDLAQALREPDAHWKGPSWDFFEYAVFNARPIALITARGHEPATLRAGIELLGAHGHLERSPNYLAIYPVSHGPTRARLGGAQASIPELKQAAIIAAAEAAFARYGASPYHRFGMSDDDPSNVRLIIAAMRALKARYPDNAFFVIDASQAVTVKTEVFADHVEEEAAAPGQQLALFE